MSQVQLLRWWEISLKTCGNGKVWMMKNDSQEVCVFVFHPFRACSPNQSPLDRVFTGTCSSLPEFCWEIFTCRRHRSQPLLPFVIEQYSSSRVPQWSCLTTDLGPTRPDWSLETIPFSLSFPSLLIALCSPIVIALPHLSFTDDEECVSGSSLTDNVITVAVMSLRESRKMWIMCTQYLRLLNRMFPEICICQTGGTDGRNRYCKSVSECKNENLFVENRHLLQNISQFAEDVLR